jgi:acetolactate synthase-1/2/3 large subunit
MSFTYRVADYIADFIEKIGVKDVFLLPGGGAMHLVDAVGQNSNINVVACLHEQAAAISAEAYSRINENIGVVMVTTGPGATNAITAVAGAWIESVPLMIISGQVKRDDMLRDAPLRQKGVQEVDIVKIVESITKFAITVENPNEIRSIMEKAYHTAKVGRCGPVWIDVPLDVQGIPVDSKKLQPWKVKEDAGTQGVLSNETVLEIRSLISKSQRPLVLAGHGVRLSGGAEKFVEWIECADIPVVSTWNALDLLPFDHPLYIGRPGVVALRAPNFAVQNCDLLISIGCRLDNIITAYNPKDFARDARKVVIDIDKNEIDKLNMDISISVNCDAKSFIEELSNSGVIPHPQWEKWKFRCEDWKKRYTVNDGKPFLQEGIITHYQLVDALSRVIPKGTLVSTGSSGLAIEAFYTIFRNKPQQRVFLTSGLGSMGYGLPAAIGACFANEKKPMVAIESDGSLQLNIQELSTIKAFNLPITLVVMNNDGYASIRSTQKNYFNERYVGTGPESGLFLPDLKDLASTYGIGFVRITDASELDTKLSEVMESNHPVIIDIQLTKNEALTPKVSALPQSDGSIISMPLEDMSPLLSLSQLKQEMIVDLLEISENIDRPLIPQLILKLDE